jgi:cleavage and polyadenylation specificity factor subunit 1
MLDFSDRLAGCTIFSKIDLRKGYWQVPVRPEDRQKTAVITPFGLFEFLRMPFGLCNAGSSFQRMTDRVLAGLPFAYCYLDDLRIASPDLDSHRLHLRLVFQRLRQFGLVINREKCVFGVKEFEFLGHLVSAEGAKPLSSYVEAVEKRPPPTTVKELQVFLGLVNFYRRFLPGWPSRSSCPACPSCGRLCLSHWGSSSSAVRRPWGLAASRFLLPQAGGGSGQVECL